MKNLEWKKRESLLSPIRKTKLTHQKNDAGKELFKIDKIVQGTETNKYHLYCSINSLHNHILVSCFKTQKDAKTVAEIIYRNSKFSKRIDARKKKK